MKRIILGAAMAAALPSGVPAFGQTYQDSGGTVVRGVVPIQPGVGPLFTASNPGKISGSFSASLSGFQPTPAYSQLSVGASSTRVGLPTGSVVIVYNTGANAAFVTLGGSTVTATTGNDAIPAGGWMAFTVGPNTFLAAIETAGTTALNISGGTGLPTGSGGGGGGGGSNASVGATGSTAPSSAIYNGILVSGGNMVGASGSAWGSAPTGLNVLGVNADVLSSALPTGAATAANQEVTAAGTSATSAQAIQGVTSGVPVTVQCPGGGTTCFGGTVGSNVTVIGVPPDATTAGSSPLTAADAASTSSTGFGGQVILTGSPTANSAETFGLNTYQGALISARGTFSNTTTLVIEGTLDNSAAQSAGTAKWSQVALAVPGQTPGNPVLASSFNAPFENAGLNVGGLQGIRCRIPSGDYTTSDSIACSVRTTLADPANVLGPAIAAMTYQNSQSSGPNGGAQPPRTNQVGGLNESGDIQPVSVTTPGTPGAKAVMVQGYTANVGGSLTSIIQAGASVPINISTATTTQLVAAVTSKAIYVTAWDVIAAGTGAITLEYGTGSNCATGTTVLTGPYGLIAQFGIAKGNGLGPVLIVPAGNALCALTSAAIQMSGSLSYTQF